MLDAKEVFRAFGSKASRDPKSNMLIRDERQRVWATLGAIDGFFVHDRESWGWWLHLSIGGERCTIRQTNEGTFWEDLPSQSAITQLQLVL